MYEQGAINVARPSRIDKYSGLPATALKGLPMFQGLMGNAREVDAQELQKDLDALLVEDEQVLRAFKILRDLFVFTNRRLILIDKQGITGRKSEYHTIPYKSISHFSVETAGSFDLDAEMKIYISGNPVPIVREFKKGTDLVAVQKTLADYILI